MDKFISMYMYVKKETLCNLGFFYVTFRCTVLHSCNEASLRTIDSQFHTMLYIYPRQKENKKKKERKQERIMP